MRTIHLILVLITLVLALPAAPAHARPAGGVVTVCDEQHLKDAAYWGGEVTFGCSGTIVLTSPITIAVGTTIDGSGQNVILSGGEAVQVFVVNLWIQLTLVNLTIADGHASGNGGGIYNGGAVNATHCTFSGNYAPNLGGAIYSTGVTPTPLTLTHCTFRNNSAEEGSAIYNPPSLTTWTVSHSTFADNSDWSGGAIHNAGGSLTVSNSTFAATWSRFYGIFNDGGSVTVTNSTFRGAKSHQAGVINNSGTVTLVNTIVANSLVAPNCIGSIGDGGGNLSWPGSSCGGIHEDPVLGPLQDNGGPTQTMALGPGSAAVDALDAAACAAAPVNGLDQRGVPRPQGAGCDIGAFEANIVTNSADRGPGSLRQALADAPAGATVLFAGDTAIQLDSDLVIRRAVTIDGAERNVTISAKYAEVFSVQPGAALVLKKLTVANGKAGGIWNWGTVNASDCIFSGNRSTDDGGAITNYSGALTVSNSTFSGNGGAYIGGGAIHNNGTATVSHCTFSGNDSKWGGAIENWGQLAVIHSTFSANSAWAGGGAIENWAQATVTSSTFSGNAAPGSQGGGIRSSSGALTVVNSTFSGNSAWAGGGIYNGGGAVTLVNTIVAGSTGGNCCGTIGGDHNLADDGSCPAVRGDPALRPLRDNGGPTQTMALGLGSAALDAADGATCAGAPVNGLDQRGVARPQGAGCDIGAFEARPGVDLAALKAHWRFDEGSGTTTADSSGGGYEGSLDGPAWTGLTAPTDFDNPHALRFDGLDDSVDIEGLGGWGPGTVSVAAWIVADEWKPAQWEGVVVGKDDWIEDGSHGFVLRTGDGGRLSFVVGVGGQWAEAFTEPVMRAGEWHHIAGAYDGLTLRAYIDGIERGMAGAEGAISPSDRPVVIGSDSYAPDRRFRGTIDDVRLYDGVLWPEEVQDLAARRYRIYLPLVAR